MRCYLCRSTMQPLFIKNGYQIFECPACGLGMTELGSEYKPFVKKQYSSGYFTGDPEKRAYENYKEDKQIIIRNFGKYLDKIKKIKPRGKLLDVGCALGFFVRYALDQGYDAYGFDPSSYAVHEAQAIVGNRVKEGTIDSVSYPKKMFDVITLLDVFEHLNDPGRDLKRLASFLKDDGILLIATGDAKSLFRRILKRKWTFFNPPQHLFYFDRITLSTLLEKEHLQPTLWCTVGKILSLKYVLHLARTVGESKIGSLLYHIINRLPIRYIPVYLPVGDNMVVIVRKKE